MENGVGKLQNQGEINWKLNMWTERMCNNLVMGQDGLGMCNGYF